VIDNMMEQSASSVILESTSSNEVQFDSLSVQGRGVDAVLAEMCALKIALYWNNPEKKEDIRGLCRSLGVYVQSALVMTCGRPHELMFNKCCTMIAVSQLLQTICLNVVPKVLPRKGSPLTIDLGQDWEGTIRLEEVRDSITTHLIESIRSDCHPQYSIFVLLTVSVFGKLKILLGWSEVHNEAVLTGCSSSNQSDGFFIDENGDDQRVQEEESRKTASSGFQIVSMNSGEILEDSNGVVINDPKVLITIKDAEIKRCIQQFLINGSTAIKVKVLEKSGISKLIPTV